MKNRIFLGIIGLFVCVPVQADEAHLRNGTGKVQRTINPHYVSPYQRMATRFKEADEEISLDTLLKRSPVLRGKCVHYLNENEFFPTLMNTMSKDIDDPVAGKMTSISMVPHWPFETDWLDQVTRRLGSDIYQQVQPMWTKNGGTVSKEFVDPSVARIYFDNVTKPMARYRSYTPAIAYPKELLFMRHFTTKEEISPPRDFSDSTEVVVKRKWFGENQKETVNVGGTIPAVTRTQQHHETYRVRKGIVDGKTFYILRIALEDQDPATQYCYYNESIPLTSSPELRGRLD